MSGLPILLLDVDGVLLPLGDVAPGLEECWVDGELHHYNPRTVEHLRRLRDSFELVWATTWEDDANAVIGPLFELPALAVIHFDDATLAFGDTWKLPAIIEHVGARPCAWVDDDIGDDALTWAEHRREPTLFLRIDSRVRLDATHVEQLERFARDSYAASA